MVANNHRFLFRYHTIPPYPISSAPLRRIIYFDGFINDRNFPFEFYARNILQTSIAYSLFLLPIQIDFQLKHFFHHFNFNIYHGHSIY